LLRHDLRDLEDYSSILHCCLWIVEHRAGFSYFRPLRKQKKSKSLSYIRRFSTSRAALNFFLPFWVLALIVIVHTNYESAGWKLLILCVGMASKMRP
jgi:hypothetical protein